MVDTRHQANLFGVRFLPCTGNLQLVTGAMDYTVQARCLRQPLLAPYAPSRLSCSDPCMMCRCNTVCIRIRCSQVLESSLAQKQCDGPRTPRPCCPPSEDWLLIICSAVQLHCLEGRTLDAAAVRWERRGGASADGITANVHTTLYAVHKGRIKVCRSDQ